MNRELDGCYFRIVRDGVGQSVCFTDLTKEERDILLADKDTQFLKNLCCYLADRIKNWEISSRSNPGSFLWMIWQ